MKPAFSSGRAALGFALFLALLVAGPGIAARLGLVDEARIYPTFTWGIGGYPWIQQQVFERRGEIDMAFLGSSHIWTSVNTPYVQSELSKQLGRRAEVVTLGWNWSGYDALYSVASNLLERRKVHTIVIYAEDMKGQDMPHPLSYRMIQVGGIIGGLGGMPWRSEVETYAGAVLGLPRHLLSFVRRDRLEDPSDWWKCAYFLSLKAPDLTAHDGSLRAMTEMPAPSSIETEAERALQPPTVDDVRVYSEKGPDRVRYSGPGMGPYNLYFAHKLARLCEEHGTQLVVLHIPVSGQEHEEAITECQPWSEVLGHPVDVVGIPGAKLFGGVPPAEVHRYFYERDHLNGRGQDLFTPLITPGLLKLYARAEKHT
jgi:hypothetical protein